MDTPAVTGDRTRRQDRRRFFEIFIGIFSSLIGIWLAVPFLVAVIGAFARARKGLYSKVAPVDPLPLGQPVDIAYREMGPERSGGG